MPAPRCLYTLLFAPRERFDGLLLDEVAPLARALRAEPGFESLFFVRFSEPEWQLRFRVLGDPAWIAGSVQPRVTAMVDALAARGAVTAHRYAEYDREYERYGGAEGMRLAEALFTLDSFAAFDLLTAERAGGLARSRREWSVLAVERLLDLAGFTPAQRLAIYAHGYTWALEDGAWSDEDVRVLERRFEALEPGLRELVFGDLDARARWGGEAAAGIANAWLAQAGPVVADIMAGLADGRIAQQREYLFWSYAHMMTNRLGIESAGEAVLRFFLHRLWMNALQRT
ncbi:MAG TPA: thiopeptide-type bacteriocin biosynthesis protein [Candidatus Eisenbacteria bacterium]|nr:thiopeptide-type bacteriocin biosynthesis protein [Candidatus Eisenbacteria bacterium]